MNKPEPDELKEIGRQNDLVTKHVEVHCSKHYHPHSKHDLLETIVAMAEGNMGGASVLTKLAKDLHFAAIAILDLNSIYGSSIWVLYKDVCDENLDTLIRTIESGILTCQQCRPSIIELREGRSL